MLCEGDSDWLVELVMHDSLDSDAHVPPVHGWQELSLTAPEYDEALPLSQSTQAPSPLGGDPLAPSRGL